MICSEAAASGVKLFDHDGKGYQLQHLQATVSAQVICVQVARGVIGAVVTGHYPLNHHPARLAMEHLEQFSFGWKHVSRPFSAAQSVVFIASTIAVAVVVCCPCHSSNTCLCRDACVQGAAVLDGLGSWL